MSIFILDFLMVEDKASLYDYLERVFDHFIADIPKI